MTDRAVEFEVTGPSATIGHTVTPDTFRILAEEAERCGFDAVSTGDHVTIPEEIPDEYPFTPSGEAPLDVTDSVHDIFLALADVCQSTTDIALGTNVCAVPLRHPLVLARHVFTLVSLSNDRFEFGIGVGWLSTEYDALDIPYSERGSRTDEFLDMFHRACREGELNFEGPHHSFDTVGFHPVPDTPPKLFVGGRSRATFRRIAEYGDGWTIYWLHPREIKKEREELMRVWQAYDRDGEPDIAVVRPFHVGTDTDRDTSRPLVGSASSVIDDIQEYIDAGVTRITLAVDLSQNSLESEVSQLNRFADGVMPAFH